jgi:hypothetical protein
VKTAPDQRARQRRRGPARVAVCPAVSGPDRAAAAGPGEYAAKFWPNRGVPPEGELLTGLDPGRCSGCWDTITQNGIAPGSFTTDASGKQRFESFLRPA